MLGKSLSKMAADPEQPGNVERIAPCGLSDHQVGVRDHGPNQIVVRDNAKSNLAWFHQTPPLATKYRCKHFARENSVQFVRGPRAVCAATLRPSHFHLAVDVSRGDLAGWIDARLDRPLGRHCIRVAVVAAADVAWWEI